eukprot:TRINITY_DN8221_c0_g1_i2.p1 TRINITY_DN8221_c0_g1~~TRINITY_DN8221_c0_g1_i2.p1  ORF type:complete len:233 (-),score=42.06 TRINITY_DN8221_c0_g1_i2:39-737(-)
MCIRDRYQRRVHGEQEKDKWSKWETRRYLEFAFFGKTGVGKRSFAIRFADSRFGKSDATVVDFKRKKMSVQGQSLNIELWVPAGNEAMHSMPKSFFDKAMGAMLLYDVSNKESFEDAKHWIECIRERARSDVRILLVAHKTDLPALIKSEEGRAQAKEWGIDFMEASSKYNRNVDKTVEALAEDVYLNNVEFKIKDSFLVSPGNGAGGQGTKKTGCCHQLQGQFIRQQVNII